MITIQQETDQNNKNTKNDDDDDDCVIVDNPLYKFKELIRTRFGFEESQTKKRNVESNENTIEENTDKAYVQSRPWNIYLPRATIFIFLRRTFDIKIWRRACFCFRLTFPKNKKCEEK